MFQRFASLTRFSHDLTAMTDPHSALAEKLYGEVTPTDRAKAKEINYMRAYSAGEIAVGRKAGQFPVTDSTALELRVLALFS